MNAVGLDGAWGADEVFVDHGHEGDVVAGGQGAEDLLERLDVVWAVVGRKRDAGEENADVRGFEHGEDLIEITARLVEREAAQTVVAAELDDDHVRMQSENRGEIGDSIFGGGAADAAVEHFVVVACCV